MTTIAWANREQMLAGRLINAELLKLLQSRTEDLAVMVSATHDFVISVCRVLRIPPEDFIACLRINFANDAKHRGPDGRILPPEICPECQRIAATEAADRRARPEGEPS